MSTQKVAEVLPDELATLLPDGEDVVLVIVDMQFDFICSREIWLLRAVERLILYAMKKGWRIVALEYIPMSPRHKHTPTYTVLTDRLTNYPRFSIVKKMDNDGGPELQASCEKESSHPKRFVLCGVNSSECVCATAQGLNGRFPQARIDVVKDACNDDAAGPAYDWDLNFYRDDNVHTVVLDQILTEDQNSDRKVES